MTAATPDCSPSIVAYRPDIDGLRAVAVLAVIAFHAFPGSLPGGFCGVDVFFVISGYLITGIILREQDAGRFSLAGFYARRMRRIFPALAVMLVMCLAIGHVMLLPGELQSLGRSILASVVFAQNFFLRASTNYFAPSSEKVPLLHLWSLAVEEQFYVVFPPLLMLLAATPRRRSILPVVLAGLVAVSFLANVAVSPADRSAAFYFPWYRGWELLAGSLLAACPAAGSARWPTVVGQSLSAGGAALLGGCFVWLDSRAPWPGWRATLPVAGVVLLIAAGDQGWCNRHVLGNRLAVGIGLISYPLYLFHWPLLAFAHIRDGRHVGSLLVAGILAATAMLAAATYLVVERSVRHARGRFVTTGLCLALASLGIVGLVAACGGLPVANRAACVRRVAAAMADDVWPAIGAATSPTLVVRRIAAALVDDAHRSVMGAVRPDRNGFRLGGAGRTTIFYGDSMAAGHAPRLAKLLSDAGAGDRGALVIADAGACPIPGVADPARIRNGHTHVSLRRALDADPTIDRVVIVAGWHYYFERWQNYAIDGLRLADEAGRRRALAALDDLAATLVARGKRVTITLPFPEHPRLSPEALLQRGFRRINCVTPPPVTPAEFFERRPEMIEVCRGIAAIAERYDVEVVDPLSSLCSDGTFITENEDGPIRFDSLHLRASFVRDHATYLDHTVLP